MHTSCNSLRSRVGEDENILAAFKDHCQNLSTQPTLSNIDAFDHVHATTVLFVAREWQDKGTSVRERIEIFL
jgi:hypothetical protein